MRACILAACHHHTSTARSVEAGDGADDHAGKGTAVDGAFTMPSLLPLPPRVSAPPRGTATGTLLFVPPRMRRRGAKLQPPQQPPAEGLPQADDAPDQHARNAPESSPLNETRPSRSASRLHTGHVRVWKMVKTSHCVVRAQIRE